MPTQTKKYIPGILSFLFICVLIFAALVWSLTIPSPTPSSRSWDFSLRDDLPRFQLNGSLYYMCYHSTKPTSFGLSPVGSLQYVEPDVQGAAVLSDRQTTPDATLDGAVLWENAAGDHIHYYVERDDAFYLFVPRLFHFGMIYFDDSLFVRIDHATEFAETCNPTSRPPDAVFEGCLMVDQPYSVPTTDLHENSTAARGSVAYSSSADPDILYILRPYTYYSGNLIWERYIRLDTTDPELTRWMPSA